MAENEKYDDKLLKREVAVKISETVTDIPDDIKSYVLGLIDGMVAMKNMKNDK